MSTIRVAGYKKHSFVDGPGVRFTVFTQGCPHACPKCHNPETWDMTGGELMKVSTMVQKIAGANYLDGVTLSGGDPVWQAESCLEIARASHRMGLNVWMYTGFTWEQILDGLAGEAARNLLNEIDVLVDGRFIAHRRDETLPFRGSSNQRIIDVKASLETGELQYAPEHFELVSKAL